MRELVLASGSPRRRELLHLAGIPFLAYAVNVDETMTGSPSDVVMTVARRKACAAARLFPDQVVLSADTVVYAEGEVLGKPRDRSDAKRMLRLLSDGWHEVYTGVCIIEGKREMLSFDHSRVLFVPLDDSVIDRYIDSGEPMDKAGSYALQGAAAMFVRAIDGSYSNVIGLPMAMVRDMLRQIGYDI